MIRKYLICPQRRRDIPRQFSWVDHRLVRHRHICRCSTEALALYLFLITVSDADGLSYYADLSVGKYLNIRLKVLLKARRELINVGLIAYEEPIYQVLALDQQLMPASPEDKGRNDGNDDNEPPSVTAAPVKPPITPMPGGEHNRLKQTAHIGTIINAITGKD